MADFNAIRMDFGGSMQNRRFRKGETSVLALTIIEQKRRRAMRAPTGTAQFIAQMGNNLIKSSLFEGSGTAQP